MVADIERSLLFKISGSAPDKDNFANFITGHFNYCIAYGEFPDELKQVDVIHVQGMKSVTR